MGNDLLPKGLDLAGMFDAPPGQFLPQFKVPWPVEADLVKYVGQAILVDGSDVTVLPVPFGITVLHARAACKCQDGENKTIRAYKGGKTDDLYNKLFAEEVNRGVSTLLAIILPDKVSIALSETFKTMRSYWSKPLGNATPTEGGVRRAVRIEVADHVKNMKKSKTGNSYYNPAAFTQWEQVALSEEQSKMVDEAIAARDAAIKFWLAK